MSVSEYYVWYNNEISKLRNQLSEKLSEMTKSESEKYAEINKNIDEIYSKYCEKIGVTCPISKTSSSLNKETTKFYDMDRDEFVEPFDFHERKEFSVRTFDFTSNDYDCGYNVDFIIDNYMNVYFPDKNIYIVRNYHKFSMYSILSVNVLEQFKQRLVNNHGGYSKAMMSYSCDIEGYLDILKYCEYEHVLKMVEQQTVFAEFLNENLKLGDKYIYIQRILDLESEIERLKETTDDHINIKLKNDYAKLKSEYDDMKDEFEQLKYEVREASHI